MAVKSIVKLGAPILRRPTIPVDDPDDPRVVQVVRDLRDTAAHLQTLYPFQRGIGLAAPQIADPHAMYALAIALVIFGSTEYVLINPKIGDCSPETAGISMGCISFFTVRGIVDHHTWVVVTAANLDQPLDSRRLDPGGTNLAALLEHEVDHLAGLLYTDRQRGVRLTPKFGVPDFA
jgi:peptide deformylase